MSEIRMFSFNFPPKGWALCNGQLLPINQNQALFSLLGTTYGGNGQTNFALPDLRGRVPIHIGAGFVQGQKAGEENHTLSMQEMPQHTHTASGSPTNANVNPPVNNILGSALNVYRGPDNLTPLIGSSITPVGNSQAHANMQPYLVINACIALVGVFPSQN
jgi:microcystin-dependent protein